MTDTTTEGWTPWGGLYVGPTTSLAECPIGLFVHDLGGLCLKTEYGNNEGRIDAYIVGSGEFFWGDNPQTIARQRKQVVRPVSPAPAVPDPVAAAVEADRLEIEIVAKSDELARFIGGHDDFDCPEGTTYTRAARALADDILAKFGRARSQGEQK